MGLEEILFISISFYFLCVESVPCAVLLIFEGQWLVCMRNSCPTGVYDAALAIAAFAYSYLISGGYKGL